MDTDYNSVLLTIWSRPLENVVFSNNTDVWSVEFARKVATVFEIVLVSIIGLIIVVRLLIDSPKLINGLSVTVEFIGNVLINVWFVEESALLNAFGSLRLLKKLKPIANNAEPVKSVLWKEEKNFRNRLK